MVLDKVLDWEHREKCVALEGASGGYENYPYGALPVGTKLVCDVIGWGPHSACVRSTVPSIG